MKARFYLKEGLAASTRACYGTPQRTYLQFCERHRIQQPLPAHSDTLCLWITSLADSIRAASIKVYLSGVKALHRDLGYGDPTLDKRLEKVFRGIKRVQGAKATKSRCPITTQVLRQVRRLLDVERHDHRLSWAAMANGTAGLFRRDRKSTRLNSSH